MISSAQAGFPADRGLVPSPLSSSLPELRLGLKVNMSFVFFHFLKYFVQDKQVEEQAHWCVDWAWSCHGFQGVD